MTGTEIDEAVRKATTAARKDGGAQPEPSKRRLTTGQRVGAVLAAALCVAAIGASAAFLLQAPAEVASEAAPTEAPAGSEVAPQEEPAAAEPEAAPGEALEEAPAGEPAPAGPEQQAPVPEAPMPDAPAAAAEPTPQERRSTVTVSVQVSSSAVGNPVSGGTTAAFEPGATVYDALMACGLSVNASQTGFGVYVSAIGGLAEFDHGGASGWVYIVNGGDSGTAASAYVLQDGDAVQWFYVV